MEGSWREPLLPKANIKQGLGSSSASVNLVFVKRLWCLMRIAKSGNCFLLVLFSILDVAILSQAGLVVGQFYNALITKNATLFLVTVGQYMLWYTGEAICKAAQGWAAEWFAIGWRQNLTQAAHHAYCSFPSLSRLSQRVDIVDNTDERVTNEIDYLCQTLADVMLKTVAAPLMILYYTCAEEIAMSDSAKYEEFRLNENLLAALANRRKLVSQHFLLGVTTKAYDYLGGVLNYCVLAIPVFGGLFDSDDSGQIANLISNASFAVLQLIYSFSQVIDTAKLVSDLAGYTSRVGELFEMLEILPQSKDSSHLSTKQMETDPIFEVHALHQLALQTNGSTKESYLICPPTCLSLSKHSAIELSVHFPPPALYEGLCMRFPGISPASLLIIQIFTTATSDETGGNVQGLDESMIPDSFCENQLPGGNCINNPNVKESNQRELLLGLIAYITKSLRDLGHWTDSVVPSSGITLSNMDHGEDNLGLSRVIAVVSTSVPEMHLKLAEEHSSFDQVDAVKALLGYTSIEVGGVSVINHPRFGDDYLMSSIFTTAPVKVFQSVLDSFMKGLAVSCEEHTESSNNGFLQSVHSPNPDVLTTCNVLPALVVNDVTFFLPGSHIPLVQNLTLQLLWGESLLVMGATGCGKTSFLRALCGLWPIHLGTIRMPPMLGGKGVLMLPQRPLMAKTGLAGQILYPELSSGYQKLSSLDILRLGNALEAVGVLHLMNHLNDDLEVGSDWADTLSPGEKQALALSRVFYHKPQLVILDEATSALSEDVEDAIYEQMIDMGISIISIAHRSRLLRHHSKVLVISGDGSGRWSLS